MMRLVLSLLFVFATLSQPALRAEGLSPFRATPLKVGVTADAPPMVFKVDNQLQGVEVDFARLLGRQLGRPVQFVEIPWQNLIPLLIQGEVDIIMSNMTATVERKEQIAFAEPYVEYGQMALVRDSDRTRFPAARDVMATRGTVAVVGGTTGEAFVTSFFPNAKPLTVATPAEGARAVMSKRADIFIYDSPVILWLGSEHRQEGVGAIGINLTVEYLAWGMRKEDTELLKQVNEALVKLQESGEAARVLDRWLPERPRLR